ncbi:hypothetical protein BLA29_014707, partial [Euroglyphus maynei]
MIENTENLIDSNQQEYSKQNGRIQQKFDALKNEKDKISLEIEFRRSEIHDLEAKIENILGEMKSVPENFLMKLDAEITNLETQLTEIDEKQLANDSKNEID